MPLLFLSPIHKSSRQIGEYLAPRCADLGMSGREAHLISYLSHYGPCPVGQLARVFGYPNSTLTSMLDRMEDRGFVDRALSRTDRRSFEVATTRAGRKVSDQVQEIVDDLEAAIRGRIRPRDLEGFQRVMKAVADATEVQIPQEETQ